MGQGLGIACHSTIKLSDIKNIFDEFYREEKIRFFDHNDSLQYQKDNEWYIRFEKINEDIKDIAIDDYKDFDNATEYLKSKIESYAMYEISYDNFDKMKNFINEFLINFKLLLSDIWIDNEYGLVINGKTFLSKLENNENWDWRSSELDL